MHLGESVPKTFPFESIRQGQKEFLTDAIRAVKEGRHLLAQAPTGLGKTAVGLASSLESCLEDNRLILFLTSRQSQHRIVVDTLKRIKSRLPGIVGVDIISKHSMCPQEKRPRTARGFNEYCELMSTTRACRFFIRQTRAAVERIISGPLHVQEAQQLCIAEGVCPHKAAIEAASKANIVVCDYNYVFSSLRDSLLPRIGRKLSELTLVVDEAHNLPDRIRSQLCGEISPRLLLRGAKDARRADPSLAGVLSRLAKSLEDHTRRMKGERRVQQRLMMDLVDQISAGGPWSSAVIAESCESAGRKAVQNGGGAALLDISSFFRFWVEAGSSIARIATGGEEGRVAYRLLDPSVLSREVFCQIHSSILMSGTLYPGEMYADLLGLQKNRVVLSTYPSPFPPRNRLTLATPHLTTLYQKRTDEMMEAIAKEVAGVADACPGNLAAFFPSYGVLSKVAEDLRPIPMRKHLVVERPDWDKPRRDMAVLRLRELKNRDGALLLGVLGGSFSEGIDYNDNLLSCVIIGGLPISPPTAEVRALNDFYASKFGAEKGYQYVYFYPAMNKVLQAAGRCIRGERDRGVVAIFDNRLLLPSYACRFPPGFDVRSSTDVAAEVRTFFYGGGHCERRDSEARGGSGTEEVDVAWEGGRRETSRPQGIQKSAS